MKIIFQFSLPVRILVTVPKFGVFAQDWRPGPAELSRAGKRPVPDQASWPLSRFYREFNPVTPTTLFTLRPLDTTATALSELQVLSDNSSIVKTNNSSFSSPPQARVNVPAPAPAPAPVITNGSPAVGGGGAGRELELDCRLLLPATGPATLRLSGGVNIQLDRAIFSNFETALQTAGPKIKTTIVHKDKSFKTSRKKKKLVRKMKQPKPVVEGPITPSQLMEVVVSKKLNFLKTPKDGGAAELGKKKYNFILPKPAATAPAEEATTAGEVPPSTQSPPPPPTIPSSDETEDGSGSGAGQGNIERCRKYRDRKRLQQRQGEAELDFLSRVNLDLRRREQHLDTVLAGLHRYYIQLVTTKQYACCDQ